MEILTALIRQRAQWADHVAADPPPSRKDNTAVRNSYRRQRSPNVTAALEVIIRCQSADTTPRDARLSLRRTNLCLPTAMPTSARQRARLNSVSNVPVRAAGWAICSLPPRPPPYAIQCGTGSAFSRRNAGLNSFD
jgi:hypothetical protein